MSQITLYLFAAVGFFAFAVACTIGLLILRLTQKQPVTSDVLTPTTQANTHPIQQQVGLRAEKKQLGVTDVSAHWRQVPREGLVERAVNWNE